MKIYNIMANNIYINTVLLKKIILKPEYLNKNLNENIEKILIKEVGDKCIKEGYVKADSINILKRSIGKTMTNNFTGNIIFDILYSAEVCNPVRNNIIKCKVTRLNKLGIEAKIGPLYIIVPKEIHNNKELFKDLQVDSEVEILIINKRYHINSKKIEITGMLANDKISKKLKINKNKKKLKEEEEENIEDMLEDANADEDLLEDVEQDKDEEQVEMEEDENESVMDSDIELEQNDDEDEEEDDVEADEEEEEGQEDIMDDETEDIQ